MGGRGSLSCDTFVLVCWIASPDPVRCFILSPLAFILGIGAASLVLPYEFFSAGKD